MTLWRKNISNKLPHGKFTIRILAKNVQNETIQNLGNMIKKEIISALKSTMYYSVILGISKWLLNFASAEESS